MNENYDMIYFLKSIHEIPWYFPDICPLFRISLTFYKIPWQFPDLEKYFFPHFSLKRGNPDIEYIKIICIWFAFGCVLLLLPSNLSYKLHLSRQ